MNSLETSKIQGIIDDLCHKIGGDWLLVGGSLVQLEYQGARATEDIDLIHLRHPHLSEVRSQDELFKAAYNRGLSPESVNSAARFFVSELKNWESQIVVLKKGPLGCVYKPNLTLFIALKLSRATETDLCDIEFAIKKEGINSFDLKTFYDLTHVDTQKTFDSVRTRFNL